MMHRSIDQHIIYYATGSQRKRKNDPQTASDDGTDIQINSVAHYKRLKTKDLCTNNFQILEDKTDRNVPVFPNNAVQHVSELSQDMDIGFNDFDD